MLVHLLMLEVPVGWHEEKCLIFSGTDNLKLLLYARQESAILSACNIIFVVVLKYHVEKKTTSEWI